MDNENPLDAFWASESEAQRKLVIRLYNAAVIQTAAQLRWIYVWVETPEPFYVAHWRLLDHLSNRVTISLDLVTDGNFMTINSTLDNAVEIFRAHWKIASQRVAKAVTGITADQALSLLRIAVMVDEEVDGAEARRHRLSAQAVVERIGWRLLAMEMMREDQTLTWTSVHQRLMAWGLPFSAKLLQQDAGNRLTTADEETKQLAEQWKERKKKEKKNSL